MGPNPWRWINSSKWTRSLTIAVVALAVAAASGAGLAQPGGRSRAPALPNAGTAPVPSGSVLTAPAPAGPTTSAPAFRTLEEPWVPVTPSPPRATPILTSGGPSDPVYYRLHISAPVVFVTIDDGWVRDPRIIDFLHQTGWPISIFLIERAASQGLPYFRQLQAAGATVEDHTFDHPYLNSLGADRQTSEICTPMHDYPGMFGQSPTLLRPPYGAWNPTTARVARTCGLSAVVEWSATFYNGRLAIAGGTHLRPGDVILLHFTPVLYSDLIQLRQILARQGLAVGHLESYISTGPPAGASATTSTAPAPTTTGPSPTTTTSSTTQPPPPPNPTSTSSTSTSTTKP